LGFLGANGAGKTTTMSMLTGEHWPTGGSATIMGHSIMNQFECRKHIGYCPQFDAIFENLTAREHLNFYCSVKGMSDHKERQAAIASLIANMGLQKYADIPAGDYSGGNKRKLSTAIALVGDPPVVILDEPSSGMDPVSKRLMWKFISKTMANRSVILTTHSMEEAQALAHRIGIMVNGNLRCLGTTQRLQSRFGNGYELNIKLPSWDKRTVMDLVDYLKSFDVFTDARLLEQYGGRLKLRLRVPELECASHRLADVFRVAEAVKEKFKANQYAISATRLEHIFINFARKEDWTISAKPADSPRAGTSSDLLFESETNLVIEGESSHIHGTQGLELTKIIKQRS